LIRGEIVARFKSAHRKHDISEQPRLKKACAKEKRAGHEALL
jgi:hypothetical protein